NAQTFTRCLHDALPILARFIGLDISEPAVSYALEVGLIDAGVTADLEKTTLTSRDAAIIRQANVVLSTGCIGYVTEKTYRQILEDRKSSRLNSSHVKIS